MKPPAWCDTPELREHWKEPWNVPVDGRKARVFKRRLWEHGFLSPNFTRKECASDDGVKIPDELRGPAQKQAFRMERYRHAIGDKPISFLDWYRSKRENEASGGASESQHMRACATDRRFNEIDIVRRIWRTGGLGWEGPGIGRGAILHTDSRPGGGLAQWSYS
jgi:Peptidase M15